MDNFMDNPWIVRIVALALAILLTVSVNNIGKKEAGSMPNGMEDNDAETIANIPVELFYDSENLVVSGVPQTVEVKIEGQRRFVEATKRQRDFTVYIDLSDVGIGKHRVPISYKDFSDKLKVTIEPGFVEISLQEKVTADFKVEAEFNRSILAEGFEAEKPEVNPKTVKITGAKDVMDKITYVKATIDVNGLISDTIKKEARVTVLDRELNKLDVIVEPQIVTVSIPVKNPRKNVPVKVKQTGTAQDDIDIQSVSTDPAEVVIFGRTETLGSIDAIEIPVDISKIREDTELEVPIKYPAGVNKITPEKIKVIIKAAKRIGEADIDDIQIDSSGLDSTLDLEILSPESGFVSIKLSGEVDKLKEVAADQFEVLMNVEGLLAGEHEVELEVSGPDTVEWEFVNTKVKIRLIEKEDV